jgi:hypothetical protein
MQSEFQNTSTLAAPVLNYQTMSGDIVWIRTLLLFGEDKRRGVSSPGSVLSAGRQIADFDPLFRDIYVFFPAMAVSGKSRLSEEELEEITRFMEQGFAQFPDDADLPFRAALNFIGYSEGADDERRLREVERAIGLLRISVARDPVAVDSVNVLRWFLNRRARLLGQQPDPDEQRRLLEGLLLHTADLRVRESVIAELGDMGINVDRDFTSNLDSIPIMYVPVTIADILLDVEP